MSFDKRLNDLIDALPGPERWNEMSAFDRSSRVMIIILMDKSRNDCDALAYCFTEATKKISTPGTHGLYNSYAYHDYDHLLNVIDLTRSYLKYWIMK